MSPQSRYLTAMITPKGLFQWKRVPFGLSSAPAAFQKIIRKIIENCDGTTNLLDDIAIAGYGHEDHDRKLDKVLSQLSKHCATINFDKSTFGADKIDFVGFTISKDGVIPLQSNIDSFLKITPPTSAKEIHSLLSTAYYYMRFVRNFADIAEPLRALLGKDVSFECTSEC